MFKLANPPVPAKGTFGRGFERYNPDTSDFLALHMWNARKRLPNGTLTAIGKAPIARKWTTIRVVSRAVRRRCLAELRNMGIRLKPNQLVIDVDPRNGGDASFAALCFDIGLDGDEWPRVYTGSGGWHCYMAKPEDVLICETLDEYPGIEFKSKGRQVVAAGSRHPDGGLYRWSVDHPDIRKGIPMVPTALLRVIARKDSGHNGGGDGGQYTVEQLARALERLDVTEFRDQFEWRNLMFACHHATNGDGERVFMDWSASDPQFAGDSAIVQKRWRSCGDKSNAITYRTLNKILRERGAADAIPPRDVSHDEFPDDMVRDVPISKTEGYRDATTSRYVNVRDAGIKRRKAKS
ncbi:hypothetical protein CQ12_21475 [Bradyrhizobium jicamae]|uniref:DNA primase/polymerase bifunctional N-terminal domain-containing protein n=1 Tax=Bradyrhizobium jicamae TaxID=280332 RepID=A0A0R3LSF0_9BRAD|nr:bifunctional DNA primase/polymerase [Bradyrhizobium jicamae]KRR10841.1 hypothetical protein CQ12_21475 [Bradyrhizobium jicamae]